MGERFNSGHLNAARALFGEGPVRAEPYVEFHRVSFDNRIPWLPMEDLEALSSIEGGRLADAGRGEDRNRTDERRLGL
jgi:hypothetical protein